MEKERIEKRMRRIKKKKEIEKLKNDRHSKVK